MSSQFEIKAQTKSLEEIFSKKYTIDYFQREYTWKKEQMQELLRDLTRAFLSSYDGFERDDQREEACLQYSTYYLGAFILSGKESPYSIVDGQQRLTSLTLLFIHLIHLREKLEVSPDSKTNLTKMVYSENTFGVMSFNISLKKGESEREKCLNILLKQGQYDVATKGEEAIKNLVDRYNDIESFFAEECREITKKNFPFFYDFLVRKVVMVEIATNSEEGAYTIFESMNDRGLGLTSSEMLKGYWLSKIPQASREAINQQWKEKISSLKNISSDDYEQKFFQDWFRAKYTESIRQTNKNAENKDFEIISTRFHFWFKDNLDKIGLKEDLPKSFENFFHKDFNFFLQTYHKILKAQQEYNQDLPHVFYIHKLEVAPTLSFPLMLAPLKVEDSESIVCQKIDLVARFLEIFYVRRKLNGNAGHSSIRIFIYNLILEIRSQDLEVLRERLLSKPQLLEYGFENMPKYKMVRSNKSFIKFLLCRMASFVQKESKKGSAKFENYYQPKQGEVFEIEHIWPNNYEKFQDIFPEKSEFIEWRENIGALVLLPKSVNQSFNNKMYEEKIDSYGDKSENILTSSLAEGIYYQNPALKQFIQKFDLPFRPYKTFTQVEIQERGQLYQKICEKLFSFHYF